ncbi:MAG: serine/threonine protein kinase [Deltaproteobacteria bacterium]|nr:MAG: serine/threonine protein kinase [Deltaproteobacteria bacterium]
MSATVVSCTQCSRENTDDFRVCPECSFPLMLVAGKYRLSHVMAEGGMGRVYLAKHTQLDYDTERVIKVIKPEALDNESTIQRFRREVQLTAALSQRNEHIVRIYDDFGEEKGLGYYYVMEFLEGVMLRDWLQHEGALPLPLALSIFSQFCKAMAAAHRKGIVHRDLKPENILLIERAGESHFVKVIDFGIARPGPGNTQNYLTKGMLGTPLYMSPEQATDSPVDTRSDIYSMGLILYEMLTGGSPYGFKPSSQLLDILYTYMMQAPALMGESHPELAGFDPVLAKALAKQPNDRYQTVEEFWNDVVALASPDWHLAPMQVPTEQERLIRQSQEPTFSQAEPVHSLAMSVGQLKEKIRQGSVARNLPTPSPVSGFTEHMADNELHPYPTQGGPGGTLGAPAQTPYPGWSPAILPTGTGQTNPYQTNPGQTQQPHSPIPEKYLKMIPWLIGALVLLFVGMVGMMVMEYYEHKDDDHGKESAPRHPGPRHK